MSFRNLHPIVQDQPCPTSSWILMTRYFYNFCIIFPFFLFATNGIFCVLIQEKGCRVTNWFRLWKEWGGQGNRAKTWHYIFNFLSTACFMFYECVIRLNGCHNDKRVQLMNPNVCHWPQRTLELLKFGRALADLGQAFCLGWLVVLRILIHCTVKSICPQLGTLCCCCCW